MAPLNATILPGDSFTTGVTMMMSTFDGIAKSNSQIITSNVTHPHNTTLPPFSPMYKNRITIAERSTSILSIVCTLILVFSIMTSRRLHLKPINRVLLMAAPANILSNVATVISTTALPTDANLSNLCQVQAVLIQWFMLADVFCALVLAYFVYLCFKNVGRQPELNGLEPWFFLLAYVVPGISAITFLIMDVRFGFHIYGNARLWCWISGKYDALRFATFYIPAVIAVIFAACIYGYIGFTSFRQHVKLSRELLRADQDQDGTRPFNYPGGHLEQQRNAQLDRAKRERIRYWVASSIMCFFYLCTWAPSFVNRAIAWSDKAHINYTAMLVASIFLPLQGFFNFGVFLVVSHDQIGALFGEIAARQPGTPWWRVAHPKFVSLRFGWGMGAAYVPPPPDPIVPLEQLHAAVLAERERGLGV